jgi:UDP-N-acetylglucosamine--N-acetylmuramyl-(pentapeptide) pyrophosphoryl-undecaprenol N-acetylglucosamine transferase
VRVAFAGGGTGGHIVPGLHLVEHALITKAGPRITDLLWFTSGRAIEERVLSQLEAPCPFERAILTLEPGGGGAPSMARIARRTPAAFRAARRALVRHRTQVLLGLGGFTSWPAALAARSLGLPVALLEINAARGKATRLVGPWSQRVFHAWRSTLPGADPAGRHRLVGAPVSPALARLSREEGDVRRARREVGFDPERPLLLVLGGSQGAGSLNAFLSTHAPKFLAAGVQVLHQCGPGRMAEAPEQLTGLRVEEFVSPLWPWLAAATLVLCRGGASTLAELVAARVPAVVVPYPHHADQHQERNASELGAGVRIVGDGALDERLAEELAVLCGAAGAAVLEGMSAALAEVAPADAALEILFELERMVARKQR